MMTDNMREKKQSTRERIIAKALALYNQFGIEYVGVRELAKELSMKGGNITYYFPTKNDLIQEIARRLSESNEGIFNSEREPGIYNFLDMYRSIYNNQFNYRSLFVSLPLLLRLDIDFANVYHERQLTRKKVIYNQLKSLFMGGYFLTAKSQDLDTILNAVTTTNRFWISEATVDGLIEDKDVAVNTYLFRLAGLLHIVASEKGKQDIVKFLKELDV